MIMVEKSTKKAAELRGVVAVAKELLKYGILAPVGLSTFTGRTRTYYLIHGIADFTGQATHTATVFLFT